MENDQQKSKICAAYFAMKANLTEAGDYLTLAKVIKYKIFEYI